MQAAVDNYALGLSAELDTSLGPLPLGDGSTGMPPAAQQSWTEWGGLFPTVGYSHNGFFDAVGPMLVSLLPVPPSPFHAHMHPRKHLILSLWAPAPLLGSRHPWPCPRLALHHRVMLA